MNIKEQNAQLADLKNEFAETLQSIDLIIEDTIITMLDDDTEPTEAQITSTVEFLHGDMTLKDYRAKFVTPKVSIPVPKQVSKPVPKKIVKKVVKKSK